MAKKKTPDNYDGDQVNYGALLEKIKSSKKTENHVFNSDYLGKTREIAGKFLQLLEADLERIACSDSEQSSMMKEKEALAGNIVKLTQVLLKIKEAECGALKRDDAYDGDGARVTEENFAEVDRMIIERAMKPDTWDGST